MIIVALTLLPIGLLLLIAAIKKQDISLSNRII